MSKLDIGTKVFIIPNEKVKNGIVGVIDGYAKSFTYVNGKRTDSNVYSVKGRCKPYTRAELAIEGDILEFANADSGESIYRTVEAIDTDHETVLFENFEKPIKANEIYHCGICGEMHIFGIDDGAVVVPNADKDNDEDEDEFNLGFMLGYLEAVEDSNDYIHTDDCIWDKAINDIDGVCCMYDLIVERRDKLTEFYNRVIELKNKSVADNEQKDDKPELTLDEIKEKLGYDFTLVD